MKNILLILLIIVLVIFAGCATQTTSKIYEKKEPEVVEKSDPLSRSFDISNKSFISLDMNDFN